MHFLKVHSSGAIVKAYQNDHVRFPTDALGAVEGRLVCRWWSARRVFRSEDRMRQYSQYTDKPGGTYWCTSRIESGSGGEFSISVGTDFAHTKWFRGRETSVRHSSSAPTRTVAGAPRPSWSSAGTARCGRSRDCTPRCSPRCRRAPSPEWTGWRCSSSSSGTHPRSRRGRRSPQAQSADGS
ncbi:hypothetical protein [Brachybacterium sp. GPGPB12]|uniref:hypothetical protein n=1 Tax=Brachybacterium sp. GPGPB12 TaxID=3023517 RepID=UPI0031344459